MSPCMMSQSLWMIVATPTNASFLSYISASQGDVLAAVFPLPSLPHIDSNSSENKNSISNILLLENCEMVPVTPMENYTEK